MGRAMAARAGWIIAAALVALCWLGAARTAHAETKIYRAAQVQLDIRDDWKIDSANNILVVTDPGSNVILVIDAAYADMKQRVRNSRSGSESTTP